MARKQRRLRQRPVLVRSLWARLVVQKLKQQGFNVSAALAEAGLELRTLNKADSWIPFAAHARLLEYAARELDDDCFGLQLSQTIDIRDIGLLGYLGIASENVEDGLQNLTRYLRIFSEAFQVELKIAEGSGTLGIAAQDPGHAHQQQANEFSYGLIIHAYRQLTGKRISPDSVQFVHQRRTDLKRLTRHFGCPVSFNRNRGQMAFSRKVLATPITSSDDRLLSILQSHADDVLQNRPQQHEEIIGRIERRLTELLPTGQGRAKVIATELGMSERTLVRRLGELGTSFAEILDSLRKDLAFRYLAQDSLSFTHIAFLLGYANQSAFSVAFRRWTGKSPRQMRSAKPDPDRKA